MIHSLFVVNSYQLSSYQQITDSSFLVALMQITHIREKLWLLTLTSVPGTRAIDGDHLAEDHLTNWFQHGTYYLTGEEFC